MAVHLTEDRGNLGLRRTLKTLVSLRGPGGAEGGARGIREATHGSPRSGPRPRQ